LDDSSPFPGFGRPTAEIPLKINDGRYGFLAGSEHRPIDALVAFFYDPAGAGDNTIVIVLRNLMQSFAMGISPPSKSPASLPWASVGGRS
jgi:hypothetical protein